METLNIDGIEYAKLDDINRQVADSLGVKTLDKTELEQKKKALEAELAEKQEEREKHEADQALYQLIKNKYDNDLKDMDAFFYLCKARSAYTDAEVLNTYKMLPKQAKKSMFSRFISK